MPYFKMAASHTFKIIFLCVFTTNFLQLNAQVFPVDTLVKNGERSNRINLVYVGDGYQLAQQNTFITHANTINNALFSQAPFQQYNKYFNCFAIKVPSVDAGAKHPGNASDEASSGGQPIANPNNYFQSTFDFASIHRLLVPGNTSAVNSVFASNLPDYDQGFVIVNSPFYGGSGGALATASTDASSANVAIHEIGHSFAGLADEYWAGSVYALEKPNMTMNNNSATNKWKNWLNINSTGIFPHAENTAWFRPHQSCKMRFINSPFCSVCQERLIDRIHQLVNMIDTYTPLTTSFTLTNTNPVNLSVSPVLNTPSTITTNWYLNNAVTPFATNQTSVTIPFATLIVGNNTVRAQVVDNTPLSKSYLPGIGYVNNLTWTINNPAVLPVRLHSFTGKIEGKKGLLQWQIDSPTDLHSFELEKSANGISFTKLAEIAGDQQKKVYDFTDVALLNGNNFYRLKIIDKDGSFKISNTIQLRVAFDKYVYKVYQDADQRRYQLSVSLNTSSRIAISITDANAKRIMKKEFGQVEKQLEHYFDLKGKATGIYFMSIFIGDQRQLVQLVAN